MKMMSFRFGDTTRNQLESFAGTMTDAVVQAVNLLWTFTATNEEIVNHHGTIERVSLADWTGRPETVFSFRHHGPRFKFSIEALPASIEDECLAKHIYATDLRFQAIRQMAPALARYLPSIRSLCEWPSHDYQPSERIKEN